MAVYPIHVNQGCCGVTRGNKGSTILRAPNHCGRAEWLRGAPKSPNIVTIFFFNAVHLLPKDLRFEHWGPKVASCPGRHLTSIRPWSNAGVAKRFDPRAEFATAWPLEGRIQHDLRDRQQLMLLHCCQQSETWHLKKFARYLAGLIKLVDGPDAAAGSSLATADVDYEEKSSDSTHPCRSPTPTVNRRDLTFPTRTQTSEQECSDLTTSDNTPQSFSRGTRSYAF